MLETRKLGDKDLSLPKHMSTLPQKVVDVLRVLPDASKRVISCGIDPEDGGMYLVTATLDVRVVMPNGALRPTSAFPSHDGKMLGVTLEGIESLQSINSELALKHSKSCLTDSNLVVNNTYTARIRLEEDATGENHEDQANRPQEANS